jgi:hypothetical protein
MSKVGREGRSFKRMSGDDLRRLGAIAAQDRKQFFSERPDWGMLYENCADRVS